MENVPEKSSPETERIIASAIKFGDEIFTGKTHVYAIEALEEAHPDWPDSDVRPEDGFMTSAGRFVQRDEAGAIARKAEQLDHLDSKKGRDAADFLDSHHIEELKPKWLK